MDKYMPFETARPIWLKGYSEEKNITAGLYTTAAGQKAILRIATSGFFRVFLNDDFVHYGPARCAHGFFRVDEIDLNLKPGVNHIALDVVCYGVNSYACPLQDSFVIAELAVDGNVQAATAEMGFQLFHLSERVQRVQRYSYQRPFAESYRLHGNVNDWRVGKFSQNAVITDFVEVSEKTFVMRNLALPKFPMVAPIKSESRGRINFGIIPKKYWDDRSLVEVWCFNTGAVDGFVESELEIHLSDEACEMSTSMLVQNPQAYPGITELKPGEFEILSFPCEKTGLIGAKIDCKRSGTIYLLVDETLRDNNDVDPLSMECVNLKRIDMTVGSAQLLTFEPVSFKYMKLVCKKGEFQIIDIHIREVICPQPIIASCNSKDLALRRIFDAARETFLQNTFDIFMDCPSRERAGWLCDSFFTGRAEKYFTGANIIERNFLENYLLPEKFPAIESGMLPMCYPADHYNGLYIPNWAMWLVLELKEYRDRSGDMELINSFKDRIYDLLAFFKKYENEDGLLERLPGWVFVEWSHANELVQDINYPSNMLYASMLDAIAEMYSDISMHKQAEKLREIIRKRSFNGHFFTDNEVYIDGIAVSSGEISETCQYYAFFTDTATPDAYPVLWKRLLEDFGPDRSAKGLWPEIWPSNAFIGNFLRLDLLRRYDCYEQLLHEAVGYFDYMAKRTGTLWENQTEHASCNHGFASYAAVLMDAAMNSMSK